MARRASLPSFPPPPSSLGGKAPILADSGKSPPSSGFASSPPPRLSSPPLSDPAMTGVTQLLDRLAAADDAGFIVHWIEAQGAGRYRSEPSIAVRLLRAYRDTGRLDRARELAAALPTSLTSWNPVDAARLAIERATLAMMDGRVDHAEAELRQATRALSVAARGAGHREQLDLHLTSAQLDLKLNRLAQAAAAVRLAEHVVERLEDGMWRIPVAMMLGHLAMRLADPRTAVKHYATALARAPTQGLAAMIAQGNMAIALGSIGRFDDARTHAHQAIATAKDLNVGWRHADGFDVLAMVEIAADRPLAALHAVDEALLVLGEIEHPTLRYQLAEHRTWALAMLGRVQGAAQWLARADKLRAELTTVDAIDEQDLVCTRARCLEACGEHREAIAVAAPHAERFADAFVTGSLNLVLGRAALALGESEVARAAVERAALSGDKHGWVFPDRTASRELWAIAKRGGDSRVVRYADRMLSGAAAAPSLPPPSVRTPSIPPPPPFAIATASGDELSPPSSEELIYVTTPDGVSRVRRTDLARCVAGAQIVVDTLSHALRVDDREVSLERRRALEPLVVQLLRRAREGLSADEILRAAGGPGPESADAEHRVRVLISRVRDLLGDAASIERVRDAGEHGRTRYRLSPGVRFALVEPLFGSER